jgi:hypothetical protein
MQFTVKAKPMLLGLHMLLALQQSTTANAETITTGIVELTAGAGYYHFDSKRDIEDTPYYGMGLGMYFGRSHAIVVNYSKAWSEDKYTTTEEVKIRKFHIDGMHFFNAEHNVRPFVVAGFGNTDVTEGNNTKYDETHFNGGFGLHYRFTPNWSMRADARNFYSIDTETNDQTLMMTVAYRFAGGEAGQ